MQLYNYTQNNIKSILGDFNPIMQRVDKLRFLLYDYRALYKLTQ